jgi:hypothetical protein
MEPGPSYKLKTIRTMHSRLIKPQTQHKNPEHMYFQLLSPLTPSVEKTVNLYRFK